MTLVVWPLFFLIYPHRDQKSLRYYGYCEPIYVRTHATENRDVTVITGHFILPCRARLKRQIRHVVKFEELLLSPLMRDIVEVDSERLRQLAAAKRHKTQIHLHQWETTYR